ncbi:MAG: AAA family ATPase [Planctomycetota bacterium]|nr:AAA family ATPase [Planctomycetota bacterium]
MILRSVEIRSFRCIRKLHVEFSEGLNVLYGPNELGKSTLVEALRAAFLLPFDYATADDFIPWGTDETPQVVVEFDLPNFANSESSETQLASTRWRVKKAFGRGKGASALLERVTGNGRRSYLKT